MKFRLVESLNDLEEKAKVYFGVTNLFQEAAYILVDGSLLDFSGKNQGGKSGKRSLDHREIADIYEEDLGSNTNYLIDFMNRGNIRIDWFSTSADIVKEPTKEQYITLYKFIKKCVDDKYKDFNLDISDLAGNNIVNRYYEGKNANVNKIMSDIKNYFKVGQFLPLDRLNNFR